jgi:hypothetical protein
LPAWAGQVNLSEKTTITTIAQTETGTFANTAVDTVSQTIVNTFADTAIDTLAATLLDTATGSIANTNISTILKTVDCNGCSLTLVNTVQATDTGTLANTAVTTVSETLIGTTANTTINTLASTTLKTETGSVGNTLLKTVIETIFFDSQPADVSIEISQEGMNFTSPFNNSLTASGLENNVGVAATTGLTQIQANAGNANVSVASNSIVDGGTLVGLANHLTSQVALKELGALTLVPGFAVQNSNQVSIAHIAGMALAGAESAAVGTGSVVDDGTTAITDTDLDVQTVATAVDIAQADINEYSAHGNVTQIAGMVRNNVVARATSGITQIQAQAGSANSAGAHNMLLVDTRFGANGSLGLNK